jgi:hypothetical protein
MHHDDRIDASVSRDAAGIGPHSRPDVRLVPLGDLNDFDVADGDADVRGWEVRTLSGREIGKVNELLVDAVAGEVVMLDIDLHGTDRHTLAPVRAAQLDRTRRVVVLDTADLQDLDAVPSLRRGAAPTDDDAVRFRDGYQRAYGERGFDRDRDIQVSRGDHDLEFRRRYAEQDRTTVAGLGAGAAAAADATRADVSRRDELLAEQTQRDAARRELERQQAEARERVDAEHRRRQQEETLRVQQAAQQQQWAQQQAAQQQAAQQPQFAPPASGTPTPRRELRWAQQQGQPMEEIVVERRPVIEEVIIRRRIVDPASMQGGAQGMDAGSGAMDRATSSGPMDRAADRLDDVKDRVDGNPASRPGPDATDRRI